MQREWIRIQAGPDAIEVRPASIYRGINLRIISRDGCITLKPEEARALLLKIGAALEANAEPGTHDSQPEPGETP